MNIFWRIGEGKVDFWRDKWALSEPLKNICQQVMYPIFVVADYFSRVGLGCVKLIEWVPIQVAKRSMR